MTIQLKNYLTVVVTLSLFSQAAEAAYPAPVKAPHAMVVTADKYATKVGVDILKKGGNAVDAAVAVGYALAVTHPCCGNLGGGGLMLIHLKDGTERMLDFRETAPERANSTLFSNKKTDKIFHNTALIWGVPGTVKGLNEALKTYGTMTREAVIRPAIRLANDGYRLTEQQARLLSILYDKKRVNDSINKIIYKKNNTKYKTGDLFKQPSLAATLKATAQKGDTGFYEGPVSDAIVEAASKYDGLISHKDLENYQVKWRKPLNCQYRGYTVVTSSPPGSGVTVCELLKLAEYAPVNEYGYLSADTIDYNVRAMQAGFADRNKYLGDPDYYDVPVNFLLSPDHIQERRKQILNDIKTSKVTITKNRPTNSHMPQTTHYSIADGYGNYVSVTYSLNDYFGSGIVPAGSGFFMNNTLDDFLMQTNHENVYGLIQGKRNLIAPLHRPVSAMAPTIILKDGKPVYVLGTPGGPTIITQIFLAVENLIDFSMNISEAVNQCRYHSQESSSNIHVEPYCFSKDTLQLLEARGYKIQSKGTYFGQSYWGAMAGIAIDSLTNLKSGAMDVRRSGGSAEGL